MLLCVWRDDLPVHSGGQHGANLGRRDLVEESLGYTGNLMIRPCRETQANEVSITYRQMIPRATNVTVRRDMSPSRYLGSLRRLYELKEIMLMGVFYKQYGVF